MELTINGDYKGLYQLTGQVEQGKSRVNIDKEEGMLLALDVDDGPENAPGAEDNFWSEVYRLPVCVKFPSSDEESQGDEAKGLPAKRSPPSKTPSSPTTTMRWRK